MGVVYNLARLLAPMGVLGSGLRPGLARTYHRPMHWLIGVSSFVAVVWGVIWLYGILTGKGG